MFTLDSVKTTSDGLSKGGVVPSIHAFTESMDTILRGKDDVCEFFIDPKQNEQLYDYFVSI